MWFRTEYAHYKLGEPSDKYQHIWRPFLQKYQIGKRIMIIVSSAPNVGGLVMTLSVANTFVSRVSSTDEPGPFDRLRQDDRNLA